MKEIIDRYRGKKTGKGHEIKVDERSGETIIWYLYWDEYEGVDDHHHMGIARVKQENGVFVVGWLQGTNQEPYEVNKYSSLKTLFTVLDKAIEKR